MEVLKRANLSENNHHTIICLVLGTIFLFFSGGKWNISLASWFAPIFLMRYSRTNKPVVGFIIITLMIFISSSIINDGLIPVQGLAYFIMMLIGSIFGALVYLFDRLFALRIKSFVSTLIFPLTSVAFGFLHISTSLYGANGSAALNQASLPLLQILSVTGMWGIIFLVSWLASFINWMWEQNFDLQKTRNGMTIFAIIMLIVFMYGNIRLSLFSPESKTIRIASVTSRLPDPKLPNKNQSWESFQMQSIEKQEEILNHSRQATSCGSKIIIWREGEIFILKEDESEFIKKGCDLAAEKNIYLGMSLATFTRNFPDELAENKIVWIDTTGRVQFEYIKAIPTPTEKCIAGDGEIKLLNYPNSKIASTICFDLDFPSFIRKFGKAELDIMISPANDWDAISKIHPFQVSFRAIENGFSLVRPNPGYGLAASYDFQGRVISSIDYSRTHNTIMISDVPVQGTSTIYSIIGDMFAWISVIVLILIFIRIILIRKKIPEII